MTVPQIVALGEPMLEFNATESGSLHNVRNYEVGYGGDTSNFCIAASRLGASTGYVTRLGSDEFGEIFMDLWRSEGIDTSHVIIEPGGVTGIYFIARSETSHSFTYYRKDSAASHLSPDDVPVETIQRAKIFHTSGITQAISNSACDATFYGMEVARKAGVLVSYDPNLRLRLWSRDRARAIVNESIRRANFVFPSLEDARTLTGKEDPEQIAALLLNMGPQVVALKLGADGALLATADGMIHLKPHRLDAVDTTGAGDAFVGAFLSGLLRGKSHEESARFANAAAALTTRGWGAVNPIPTLAEVEQWLETQVR